MALKTGWRIGGRFIDSGISGAKGRDQRPAFDDLVRAKAEGKTLGRPRTGPKTEAAIREALAAGGKSIG